MNSATGRRAQEGLIRMTATLMVGAPGTGKSRGLIRRAVDFVRGGGDAGTVMLLGPGRLAADRLREDFSAAIEATVSTPPARAWHSYAFDVLRRAHAEGLLPGVDFEPRLLAGPEQDVLIGEMLAAHRQGTGRPPRWPEDLHEALGTRGFRREIREFLDRCAEFDVSAEQVRDLGRKTGRPEWIAAADFRVEYEDLRRLRMPHAFDPSALIHEAAAFLESSPEWVGREHERLRLILVDDLQEATPAIMRLLKALFPRGSRRPPELVMTACTDTVVQGFRGARPELLATLAANLPAFGTVTTTELSMSHRMPPGLVACYGRIADRIPVVAHARASRRPHPVEPAVDPERPVPAGGPDPSSPDPLSPDPSNPDPSSPEPSPRGRPEVYLVRSEQHELRFLSQLILEEHVKNGRELNTMAVVVRDGSALSRIKRHLEADGIAASVPVAETPLREEPAVRPFLDALWLLSEPADGLDQDRVLSLLTSRLGGASPSTIRRLRQTLRARELRSGGHRSSDDLLVAALVDGDDAGSGPGSAQTIPEGPATGSLRRVGAVLRAGRDAAQERGATAETVLWAAWEASGLAAEWERESRRRGPAADRANRDLDAMVELFKSAERYVEQHEGAGPAEFLDYVDSQDLPMDTLAPAGAPRSAVSLVTPASAAGREWAWVCVASVQEGVWPNTTVRGGLLSTPQLTDALTIGPEQAASVTYRTRVQETRYDELRTFATAVSRASERLVVTAVMSDEDEPSEFLALVEPEGMLAPVVTEVRRPSTLRGLVAELRVWAQSEDDPYRAERAAACLARLAAEGSGPVGEEERAVSAIPGANPAEWWGLAPLSDEAAPLNAEDPVTISPSRLESIERSPLDWFVSASGGQPGTDLSRSVGTLIHEVAQDMPEAPGHELVAELDRRFSALGLPDTWETRQTHERAVDMIQKFAQYAVESRLKQGRSLVGVEGTFQVLVPGPARQAILAGRVDRLEVDALGRYVVIDLKTGKSAPTAADMERHPQLAAYQVALAAGAGADIERTALTRDEEGPRDAGEPRELTDARITELSGGAALVQLGTGTKNYREQIQDALSGEDAWAVELVQRCAELIAHSRFQARHTAENSGGHGISCALPEICPLCAPGRQVTQP